MKRIKIMISDNHISVLYQMESGDLFMVTGEKAQDWQDSLPVENSN